MICGRCPNRVLANPAVHCSPKRVCLPPQREGHGQRLDARLLPPRCFVTLPVNFAMMQPTNRHRELIAHLASKRRGVGQSASDAGRRVRGRTPGMAGARRTCGAPCRASGWSLPQGGFGGNRLGCQGPRKQLRDLVHQFAPRYPAASRHRLCPASGCLSAGSWSPNVTTFAPKLASTSWASEAVRVFLAGRLRCAQLAASSAD